MTPPHDNHDLGDDLDIGVDVGESRRWDFWKSIALLLAGFILGVVPTGAISYVAMWGAFQKDAVTKAEMVQYIKDNDSVRDRRIDELTDSVKSLAGTVEIALENQRVVMDRLKIPTR